MGDCGEAKDLASISSTCEGDESSHGPSTARPGALRPRARNSPVAPVGMTESESDSERARRCRAPTSEFDAGAVKAVVVNVGAVPESESESESEWARRGCAPT